MPKITVQIRTSFFPIARSNSTPHHCPALKAVAPWNLHTPRYLPCLPLMYTARPTREVISCKEVCGRKLERESRGTVEGARAKKKFNLLLLRLGKL